MLYQMFAGRLPFEADGLGELLLAHMTAKPAPLRELVPELPPHLEADRGARDGEDARGALPAHRARCWRRWAIRRGSTRHCRATARKPGTSWEVAVDEVALRHASEATSPPRRCGGRRRQQKASGPWLAVTATLAVLGAAGAFVWKARTTSGTHEAGGPVAIVQPAVAPTKPVAAATPEPKPEAKPEPAADPKLTAPAEDDVHVQVRVQPATAQLFLDGAPISNPFDGHFQRSNASHKLEARAGGHKSEVQWIAFDHDRSLDVALGKAVARPSPPDDKGKKPEDGRPVYKGTKGKLITEFPSD